VENYIRERKENKKKKKSFQNDINKKEKKILI
jgi:hypothetical protein